MIESPSPMRDSRLVSHTDLHSPRSGEAGVQTAAPTPADSDAVAAGVVVGAAAAATPAQCQRA